MTGWVRPEIRAAFWRWRESLFGAGLVFLGSYWFFVEGGLVALLGIPLGLAGAALVFLGLQRGRFRRPSVGLGAVDVDEGQITYFGPLTGGAMSLREVRELSLIRSGSTPHWRLSALGQEPLFIPLNAAGQDDLFNAFTSLPGLRVEALLSAQKQSGSQDQVIWTRG